MATALLAVAGCTTTTPSEQPPVSTPTRPAVTNGALCDTVAAFFTDELHAVDVRAVPAAGANLNVGSSTVCEVTQERNTVGYYSARSARNDPDPTDGIRGFVAAPALGEAIWLYDLRADAANPSTRVRFATRIGHWNATLEIRDTETRVASGELHITDEDKRKAVGLLEELTRSIAD
ncbi:hypothetical protein AB0H71_30080 [Nocardia sp. NPDC050697]|uniref:hypothetical protein n=1 Tax=Nocardia sp. NPDC050697 TaxID=3155158 RepID=UPI0033F0D8F8